MLKILNNEKAGSRILAVMLSIILLFQCIGISGFAAELPLAYSGTDQPDTGAAQSGVMGLSGPVSFAPADAPLGVSISDYFGVGLTVVQSSYPTYQIPGGAQPPTLQVKVSLTTKNRAPEAAIPGGKILLPLQSAAPDGNVYFIYASDTALAQGPAMIQSVAQESGNLVISLKEDAPPNGSHNR